MKRLCKLSVIQKLIGNVIYFVYCLWCKTLQYKEKNKNFIDHIAKKHSSAVVCLWHDELFPLSYLRKTEKVVAVVSQSSDGDLLSSVLERLGLMVVRGSSSRGGVQALRNAIKEMGKGVFIFFTVDGPRGPRHRVKKGALFLADKCEIPIIPVRVFMDNSIRFKSWDRFQLPLPFSHVSVVWGEPYNPSISKESECMAKAIEVLKEKLEELR